MQQQRQRYRKQNIGPDKIDKLQRSGFRWRLNQQTSVDPERKSFEVRLKQLIEYRNKHGHMRVPQAGTKEHPQLGKWVWWIRISRRRGLMQHDKIEILERAGFLWDVFQSDWDAKYGLMCKHKMDHGHLNVWATEQQDIQGRRLLVWAANQRQEMHRKSMIKARLDLLEALGFEWIYNGTRTRNTSSTVSPAQPDPLKELSRDSASPPLAGDSREGESGVLIETAVGEKKRTRVRREMRSNWRSAVVELMLYRLRHGTVQIPTSARVKDKMGNMSVP